MLLTLTASCLRSLLLPGRSRKPKLELLDLPVYTKETLGLTGINLSTDLLIGADRARLEGIRERADRASCSCLLLVEHDAQLLGAVADKQAIAAVERLTRVVEAAQILGCSAAAVRIEAADEDGTLLRVAGRLKPVMERAEKLDINLLITPHKGLTARPERVTELLKKVGGFRIGTYPDFQTAAEYKDPAAYLHRLTPYATALSASTVKFVPANKKGEPIGEMPLEELADSDVPIAHVPYDLRSMVDAVSSVGYDGPLALDYRGTGDVTIGLSLSRDALAAAMGAPMPEGEDDDEE